METILLGIISLSSIIGWLEQPMIWLVLLFGLILGSFYNVCIWRLPEESFWKTARSACRGCSAPIPWYYNFPVVSWFFLRGKAACCGQPISVQYPLVELFTGIALVIIYMKFPFYSILDQQFRFDPTDFIRFMHFAILFSVLLISSVIDLRHMIIPDELSLGLVVTTPLVVWLLPGYTWQDALLGVLIGGGSLYFIAWVYWITRKISGMGMGDVKLLAGIGGWLGWQSIFPIILYSSLLGSVIGVSIMLMQRKKDLKFEIPFGPFLAVGALLHLYFGTRILEVFFSLSGSQGG